MFAQDQSDTQIQLGVTSSGLVVFQNNVRINTFSWSKIVKISFKRKQFFIQLRKDAVRHTLTSRTYVNHSFYGSQSRCSYTS